VPGHRKPAPRWLAAGGAVALAAVVGVTLLLQNGGSACAAPPSTSAAQGKATFYDLGDGTGTCSFPGSPADDLFVALGPAQYSDAAACGTYLDVTGPKGKVRVKVTDSCPECDPGHLDLSRTAFKKIADEVAGIVPITYRTVAAPVPPAPLSAIVKDGSSQYWLSVLIDNHGSRLASVQIAGAGGTFHTATRADYNYWSVDGGLGPGPFKIKIIDAYGASATMANIKLAPGTVQRTSVRLGGSSGGAVKTPPPSQPSQSSPLHARSVPASRAPSTAPSTPAPASPAASPAASIADSAPATETETPAVALAAAPAARCGG
jgi:expansin (peptidoglycan-binding protein)